MIPIRSDLSRRLGEALRLAAAAAALLVAAGLLPSPPEAPAAPRDTRHGQDCTTSGCHPMPDDADGAIAHLPFLEEWCDRCHTDHSSSAPKLLSAPEPELCLACHKDTEMHAGKLAHPPGDVACTTCHDPHRSGVRHLLRTDDMRLGCVQCHGEQLAREREKPHHHRFFDPQKECGSCHFAHSNSDEGFIRPNVGETCLTCHDMSVQSEGRKLENLSATLKKSRHVHPPAAEGACQACHTPHGSVQPSLLKDSYPAGNYDKYQRENYGLCWQCHDPATVEANQTRTATRFRDGSRNLHELHVVKAGKGRACHLCHTPHAADRPHLIRETMRFGAWDAPFDYQPSADGGTCATACHKKEEYSRTAGE